jgi:hypothetical protein
MKVHSFICQLVYFGWRFIHVFVNVFTFDQDLFIILINLSLLMKDYSILVTLSLLFK